MSDTFYWHDYETFGTNPFADRPAQFALPIVDVAAARQAGKPKYTHDSTD